VPTDNVCAGFGTMSVPMPELPPQGMYNSPYRVKCACLLGLADYVQLFYHCSAYCMCA